MRFNVRAVLSLASVAVWAQTAPPPASELHDPPGHSVALKVRTLPTSVQVYTCRASGNGYSWTGPDPDAIIADDARSVTIHHYRGPTWEATDGSMVHGSNPKHFRAARTNAVDWLELSATGGTGRFAKVTIVHRIDTSGGVAPPTGCDGAHLLDEVRVPYIATYVFYAR